MSPSPILEMILDKHFPFVPVYHQVSYLTFKYILSSPSLLPPNTEPLLLYSDPTHF